MDNFENPKMPVDPNSEKPVENAQIPQRQNFTGQYPQNMPPASNRSDQNTNTGLTHHAQPLRHPPSQPQYRRAYCQPPIYPVYPQYGYYAPGIYPQPVNPYFVQRKSEPGISIASFVISLASLVMIGIPFLNIILALLGVVLGIVGMKHGGGFAIAGTVIGSIVLSILIFIYFVLLVFVLFPEESVEYGYQAYDWSITFLSTIRKL